MINAIKAPGGRQDIIKKLLAEGLVRKADLEGHDGEAYLRIAFIHRRVEAIEALFAHGVSQELRSSN